VELFIGNNSGPLHLAAALGKSTVSAMGPTDSRLWAPAGEGHIVLKKEVSCSPCNRPVCEDHRCMKLITVDEMFEAASLEIERIKKVNE
jgi:ADP-heptose:LPS heptosyltransferase